MIAKVAAKLVYSLKAMEVTCEAVGTFWTMEANTFQTQGQKMITDEIHYPKILLEKAVSKEDIKTWEKAKSDFDQYANIMSIILNLFNYVSDDVKPNPTKQFKLDKLDLKLSIPASLNVKKIMAGGQ